jgi:hypothetical protein
MLAEIVTYENKYPFQLKARKTVTFGSQPSMDYLSQQMQLFLKGQVTKIEIIRKTENFVVFNDDGTKKDERGNPI